MGLSVTTDDKGVKVIRKEVQTASGGSFFTYSLMIGTKKPDETWANGFIDCRFKKDVVVNNKAKIKINSAFYVVDEYKEKKYPKIMITDFEVLEPGEGAEPTTVPQEDFISVPDGELDDLVPFS